MKILARATSLAGYVDAVAPALGTIELAGLQIHMEHGAVVRVGDFVDVEASFGADRIWTGRIKAHFIASAHEGCVSPEIHTPSGTRPGAHSPAAAPGGDQPPASSASAADPAAGTPAPSPADRTPQGSPIGASGGSTPAAPSGTPPAGGRRRFGAPAGGQRAGTGPNAAATGSAAPARPRFTPSSADQKVNY